MFHFHKVRFALVAFFVVLSHFAWAAAPLKVLSAAPRGTDSASARQPVTVTFNQPVVALAEASEFSSENCPLTLTPAVKGTCRYSGTQTLQFEPAENWPQATQFTGQIKKGFSSQVSGQKLAESYTFTFSTQTPRVRRVLPRKGERWISLNPSIYVQFSLPVTPEKLIPFSILQDDLGNKIPLQARALSDKEYETDFSYLPKDQQAVFIPSKTLQSGRRYTLTFKEGLKATSGRLGMSRPYSTHFFTYPPLAVQGVLAEGCLPYTPGIRFSSPVRLRELVQAVTVSPASAYHPLSDADLDSLGYDITIDPGNEIDSYLEGIYQSNYGLTKAEIKQGAAFFFMPLSFLNLPPRKPVQVTISKELRDIYGNRLGQDYTFTASNTGYCPSVSFSGGFGVLESYLKPRLPIEIMNVASLPVKAARFNKENFIPFYNQSTRYCKARALKDPTYDADYSFKEVVDKARKTFLDLTQFKPTGSDSIIFSQIKVDQKGEKEGCWRSATSNITDVGVTFKTSPQSILIWTTSLEAGTPMAAMNVELRDKNNTVLWTGSTDDNGLAIAPGWEKLAVQKSSWGQPVLYVFVSSAGGDAVLSTELNGGMDLWRFNVPFTYSPKPDALHTELFTERGIYRPGETIYVKGVSRVPGKEGWVFPQGLKGQLKLMDSHGEEVASKEVSLSNQGSFHTSFEVPVSARTGDWEIAFTPLQKGEQDPATQYISLRVEAVKQAEFEVTVHTDKKDYFPGETLQLSAAAVYNFGAPLSQALAKGALRREMAWFEPKDFEGYVFTPYFLRENEHKESGKLIASTTGKTDDKGAFLFEAPLPEVSTPTELFAEVGVQSPARQDLFSRTSVKLHPASFYVGAKVKTEQPQAGKPVEAHVVAVTPQGKNVPAQVTAQIRKIQWYSVRKTGLSGRLEWVSEKQEIELPSQTFEVTEQGATFSFIPAEGGNYQITFVSHDAAGRTVRGGFDTHVIGQGESYWRQQDDDLLTLKQDKNSYKPGQKARINVQSPYESAVALVTVEREGILDAWVTSVKQGADYIEVPIKENYLPNVYVGVTLVRGRSADPVNEKDVDLGKPQGKTGYVALNVAPEKKRIDVSVKTNNKNYRPGEEVTVKLVTKVEGKTMPAEVTVMVVDEGMLALTNYKTPDLFSAFYHTIPLSVFTADNRAYVIGQRNFGEKGENRGGGGSYLSKLGGADLRSHFSFVPYFNATVQTNAKGRAEVRFKLPDNLTKFRIMAVAARETEFGSAETAIHVSKPLMITANLPRLAREGDSFNCGAVVYNYEDKKGVFVVSVQTAGALLITSADMQTVSVPLGSAREVSWPCKALYEGNAQISFRVQGKGKQSDGMLAKLSVEPVEKFQTLALYDSTEQQQEQVIQKPSSLNQQANNRLELSLASTALLQLTGALTYLKDYPFNCLEQQLSKSIPVITGEKLIEEFKLADVSELRKNAQDVFNRLGEYQASTGGFGYWKNPTGADPYLTAYALEVAHRAKQQGYQVPQEVLQKAVTWLEQAFNTQTKRAYVYSAYETDTARAYAAYVLSLYGKNTDSSFNALYAQRTTLPLPAIAYLLKGAYASRRDATIQRTLAQQLLNQATYTPTAVHFSIPGAMPWLHMDNVTATALALEALLVSGQPFEQAYQSVSWLLTQLTVQGHWNSTQSNAAVLASLGTYYKTHESVSPDFTAQVMQGSQILETAIFKGHDTTAKMKTVPLNEIYTINEQARLLFKKQGTGRLYYKLAQIYTPARYENPVNAGFEITRTLTTSEGKPVVQAKVGERYQITLTVRTASPRYFVVLEDFVPAGFEIVNTSLATESRNLQDELAQKNDSSYFANAERYDGHLAAFADYLPAGTHTYSYAIHATTAGTFSWPSAWVSEMYDPAVFGRDTTSSITVQ